MSMIAIMRRTAARPTLRRCALALKLATSAELAAAVGGLCSPAEALDEGEACLQVGGLAVGLCRQVRLCVADVAGQKVASGQG